MEELTQDQIRLIIEAMSNSISTQARLVKKAAGQSYGLYKTSRVVTKLSEQHEVLAGFVARLD